MIESLNNTEIMCLLYLKSLCDLPDDVVAETEYVILYRFLGQYQNRLVNIPIEIITIGSLEYVAEKLNYPIDEKKIIEFVEFLCPKNKISFLKKIDRMKRNAFNRFNGKDMRYDHLRLSKHPFFDFWMNTMKSDLKMDLATEINLRKIAINTFLSGAERDKLVDLYNSSSPDTRDQIVRDIAKQSEIKNYEVRRKIHELILNA
jgi:hypothetical protein